ncbi:MAG: DUF1272 domain-containing protein [Woeseiaceae bacterium]|nr:DUF1272 domain-containing protein [Woeseiaceae bacterium]
MLEIRPNCEACDTDLPPASKAYICTFECTFCEPCTAERFDFVCPNCGGDLVRRPVRPERLLVKYPPSTERVLKVHE